MKILKDKTYNELISIKEEFQLIESALQKERQIANDLYMQIGSLTNEKEKIKQDFEKKIDGYALNFSVKRLVLGKKGIGKTMFIKNKILPKLKNYFIIDFNNEYSDFPEDKRYAPPVSYSADDYADCIMRVVKKNEDKVIIIDDVFLAPNLFEKFMRDCGHFDYIISAQSKLRIEKHIDRFDFIFDLGTLDNFSDKYCLKSYKEIILNHKNYRFGRYITMFAIGFGLATIFRD